MPTLLEVNISVGVRMPMVLMVHHLLLELSYLVAFVLSNCFDHVFFVFLVSRCFSSMAVSRLFVVACYVMLCYVRMSTSVRATSSS